MEYGKQQRLRGAAAAAVVVAPTGGGFHNRLPSMNENGDDGDGDEPNFNYDNDEEDYLDAPDPSGMKYVNYGSCWMFRGLIMGHVGCLGD